MISTPNKIQREQDSCVTMEIWKYFDGALVIQKNILGEVEST